MKYVIIAYYSLKTGTKMEGKSDKLNIYVASSCRNEIQPMIVRVLRELGHQVYDFKNPEPGDRGFHWSAIDVGWQSWTPDEYRKALDHPVAEFGFRKNMNALNSCDVCVLVLPSGRSAHTEAGIVKGKGRRVYVFQSIDQEPELMYKAFDGIIISVEELKTIFK